MSLIPDRYRCSKCDGYVGDQFSRLSSQCKCPRPSLDDELDELRAVREQDPSLND